MRPIKSGVFSLFLLTMGCAAMPGAPGHVSTHVSDFDKTREVSMEPAAVPTPGDMVVSIQLGAHWTSEDPDSVSLIAATPREITSIRREEGLLFNIDGEVTSLSSPTTLTEHDSEVISGVVHTESSRPFTASLDFAEKLAEAQEAGVKLRVGENKYFEARMESEGMNAAFHRALNKFLAEVRAQKQAMKN